MSTYTADVLDGAAVRPAPAPAVQPVEPGPSTRKLAIIGLSIALLAGGIGALISGAAFPAKDGKVGASGPAGPAGPPGSAASVAKVNVDTNKLGYCFTTNGGTDSNGDYSIRSVSLFPPTVSSGGALSCPEGQFVSLTPDSPQGGAVSNYNAMVPTTGTPSSPTASTPTSSTTTP
jgi:hypothetical protein